MSLSSVSIKRPVLTIVMSLVIVLFGVMGFIYLGVREYPSVDPPIVTVRTDYPGANSDVIESQITEPLEESINSVEGIRTITSVSSDGRSSIRVEFELDVDMDAAANDVRDKTSRAVRNLPPDADPPIVQKSDADAETILSITVKSDQRDLLELTEVGINLFKERLQTIQGISQINIWGEKKYAMRLQLNPELMTAYDVTPAEIRTALEDQNVELPSGQVRGYRQELTVRTLGRLETEEEFDNMIIKEQDGVLVRFKDIGKARLAPENERTYLRGDLSEPMIGVAIQPQPGANYIEIADEVFKRVELIKRELPEDYKIGVALDTTQSIRRAITEVQQTIFLAFGLVVLTIFFFLRNARTTIVPIVAIPISLVGTFFVMYVAGFSINILTLLGIVLATGLVVDDAIVMMENIYQRIERGEDKIQAAFKGAKEIFFAIISTTVVLVCVFLPVIFLQGLTGRLFREFGIVVAGAVIISSFVSLTLTPMLSSRVLKKQTAEKGIFKHIGNGLDKLISAYRHYLNRLIDFKIAAFAIMGLAILAVWQLFIALPSELAPMEDKSRLRIFATAPEGVSFEMMDDYVKKMVSLADTIEGKESLLAVTSPGFGSSVSVNSGFVRVTLKPPGERKKSQMQIAEELGAEVSQHTFARTYVTQEQTISAGGGGGLGRLPVQFVVQAPTLEKLRDIIPRFMEKAQQEETFQVVNIDLKFNKPELKVEIDRESAREQGVSVLDVAQTIQLYLSELRFGFFIRDGKQYYVIGEAFREDRDEPSDLLKLTVRNAAGEQVRLETLIDIDYISNPPELYRYNRYVSATFQANPAEGKTMGDGIKAMRAIGDEVLDETFTTDLAGPSKEFAESSDSLALAFALALILVYLALAAQFESFWDPLTIMTTVPLALAGALLSLWVLGHTLNIFSEIGMIVLIGIVTKNGILIVEFANQRRLEGFSIREAAVDAAASRFRPILMTSTATILGALPIALALGGASSSRIPMGVAIIGGLALSLGITLFVTPTVYTVFASITGNKKRYVEED